MAIAIIEAATASTLLDRFLDPTPVQQFETDVKSKNENGESRQKLIEREIITKPIGARYTRLMAALILEAA